MYFLENVFLYCWACCRQTKCAVMMTKEGSTKIVNFMTPGAGVLMLGHGHISHIVKMHYFFLKSALFPSIDQTNLIFIYFMMWLLICKYEPFWREVNIESLILSDCYKVALGVCFALKSWKKYLLLFTYLYI